MDWILTEIDGKIASVAADYGQFARIAAEVAKLPAKSIGSVSTRKISTDELLKLDRTVGRKDILLFGSNFQKKVWNALFDLSHGQQPRLYSYTEFAERLGMPSSVRQVAHAVAINPIVYILPCHLIVPKETMDRAREIYASAAKTLFKGSDIYLLDTIDVGEYAYGPALKRSFIKHQLDAARD
ncbi:MAG: methylated-DNA--[Bacteroidales bacterium]|nr:methylated-DNA--[protein]-cysteine S-methyltransferase [Bacteroidales bacterium]